MGRVNPTEYATLRPVSHLVNSFVPPAPSARISTRRPGRGFRSGSCARACLVTVM